MHMFKDPVPLARAATVALWAYLALELLYALASLYLLSSGADLMESAEALALGLAAVGVVLAMIVCFVLVGRWIYRANANAHSFSEYMSISPRGAIGWYFVPIANLFKPFQAMKEIWLASHYRGNWHSEPTPSKVNWWWGLWILTNILNWQSFRMTMDADGGTTQVIVVIDLIVSAISIPLSLILISMIKEISAAQVVTHQTEAFA